MVTFGDTEIEWRDAQGATHVMVATAGSAWDYLCHADPARYVVWDNEAKPPVEVPTSEAVVWKHDRKKVTCEHCVAVLDGAVVERRRVSL